ncbi:hypothetical protein V6N11_048126 [Hibiscus sabdariffa]|uniref:Uncharacterized protein n=2 Tax=Hibiscus sabdariffa TaxID=183260 RepID=A0ABR1ZKU8_9ROSI
MKVQRSRLKDKLDNGWCGSVLWRLSLGDGFGGELGRSRNEGASEAGKGHHGGCWEGPRVAEVVIVPLETKGQAAGYWALKM